MYILVGVIQLTPLIYIFSILLIEKFTWHRVLIIPYNIIIGHNNYLFLGNPLIQEEMVSVANVCLVTVVYETRGACH
jgi:hypothetical protein